MRAETCETCRYSLAVKQRSRCEIEGPYEWDQWECRRYAKKAHPGGEEFGWPIVDEHDWCGEWVAK